PGRSAVPRDPSGQTRRSALLLPVYFYLLLTSWADRAGPAQRLDLRLAQPEALAEHRIGVLADERRVRTDRARGVRQPRRRPDDPHRAGDRMLGLDERAARLDLGMADDL